MFENIGDDAFQEAYIPFDIEAEPLDDAATEDAAFNTSPADTQADLAHDVGEYTLLGEIVDDDQGKASPDEQSQTTPYSMIPMSDANAESPAQPELQVGGSGASDNPPGELPAAGGESSDDGEAELFARLEGELDPTVAAVEKVADLYLDYGEDGQADPGELVTEDMAAKFDAAVHELAGQKEQFQLVGQVTVRAEVAVDPLPDSTSDLASSAGAVPATRAKIEITIPDPDDYELGEPWAIGRLTFTHNSDGSLVKNVSSGTQEGTTTSAGNDEVRQFVAVLEDVSRVGQPIEAQTLSEDDRRAFEDEFGEIELRQASGVGAQPSREVSSTAVNRLLQLSPKVEFVDGGDVVNYTAQDLERFINEHPGIQKNTMNITPVRDPERPDYWVRATRANNTFMEEGYFTPEEIAGQLDIVRSEYGELQEAGAIIPMHANFVITDKHTRSPMIVTVAQSTGSGQTLSHREDQIIEREEIPAHERAAEAVSKYLDTTMLDGRVIIGITDPRHWGIEGEFYATNPVVAESFAAVRWECGIFAGWLEELPSSPVVDRLREVNQGRLDWFIRLLDKEDPLA